MRIWLLPLLFWLAVVCPLFAADVPVRGYTRKDGTYVQPHVRSAPNSTKSDNFSTRGNVNPYTGQPGTKALEDNPAGIAAIAPPSTNGSAPTATASDLPRVAHESTVAPLRNIAPESPRATTPVRTPNGETPTTPATEDAVLAELRRLSAQIEALSARVAQLEGRPVAPVAPAGVASWRKLELQMTKDQVRALLGEPRKADSDKWHYGPLSYERYVLFSSVTGRVLRWVE